MTTSLSGSNAGAPAATGDHPDDPGQELPDEERAPPTPTEHIPEKDRDDILSRFQASAESDEDDDDGKPNPEGSSDDDDEDDDLDDDDLDDEEDDSDDDDDLDDDDEDEDDDEEEDEEDDEDEDDISDDDLDEVEKTLDERKQSDAFAHLRTSLRKTKEQLKELEPYARMGQGVEQFLADTGLDDKTLRQGMSLIAQTQTDPLGAIKEVKGLLSRTVKEAQKRYPDLDLSGLTAGEDDGGADSALPQHLQQAVDDGIITEEQAQVYAKAERGDDPDEDNEDDGGDTDPALIQNAQEELRKIGFYEGCKTQADIDKRVDERLMPEVDKIAKDLGLDVEEMDAKTRTRIMLRAAKNVVESIRKRGKKRKRKRGGRMLQSQDGSSLRTKKGEAKSYDDLKRRALSEFK